MRLRELFSESSRNISSGTTRATPLALTLTLIIAGLAVTDGRSVSSLIDQASTFRRVGATTLVLSATAGVNGTACDRLAGQSGVTAAGALRRENESLRLTALPGAPIPLWSVTTGFTEIFMVRTPGQPDPGFLLSRSAADQAGLTPSSRLLSTNNGLVKVDAIYDYPQDGRIPTLGYAALMQTVASAPFDACWARFDHLSDFAYEVIRSPLLASGQQGVQVTTSQLNSSLGTELDTAALFASRPTRFMSYLTWFAGLVLGYLSVRRRRLELASALHAGLMRSKQALQILLETAYWATAACLLSLPWLWLSAHQGDHLGSSSVVLLELRTASLAWLGVLSGGCLGAVLTREKHLFQYFKDR